jgi:hypothetical protein
MTLSIKGLFATLIINATQHKRYPPLQFCIESRYENVVAPLGNRVVYYFHPISWVKHFYLLLCGFWEKGGVSKILFFLQVPEPTIETSQPAEPEPDETGSDLNQLTAMLRPYYLSLQLGNSYQGRLVRIVLGYQVSNVSVTNVIKLLRT